MKSKKGLGVVIATSLFLVVAIVATIGFQMWFNTYSSQNQVKVEDKTDAITPLKIESMTTNKLYLSSKTPRVLNSFKIRNGTGETVCEFNSNENLDFNSTMLLMNFDNNTVNSSYVRDLSYRQNLGSIGPGVTCLVDGVNNEACYFNGVTGSGELLVNDSEIIQDEFTISFWAKLNYSDGATWQNLVSLGVNTDLVSTSLDPENQLGFRFDTNTSFNQYLNPRIGNYSDLNWHHAVLTYKNNVANLYFDYSTNSSKVITGNYNLSGYDLKLGSWFTSEFNGTIDEVAIYSKGLSDSEVLTLYKARKALYYEQIIPNGIKELDISQCNLTEGETYEVVAFTPTSSIQQKVVAK